MTQILVVHGALGSAAQMQLVASALKEMGNVVVPELPGHGVTSLGDAPFGMNTFVNALADCVAALKLYGEHEDQSSAAPLVFGYSMGGYVALALEAQRPGTFSGIVTLGTKFAWTPEVATIEKARLNPQVIAEKIPKFAALLAERHATSGGWFDVLSNTSGLLAALGDNPILNQRTLESVRIPVTIAVGERDETVSAAEAQTVASWMDRAKVVVIPDAPHPIERVSTAAIAALVQQLRVA